MGDAIAVRPVNGKEIYYGTYGKNYLKVILKPSANGKYLVSMFLVDKIPYEKENPR